MKRALSCISVICILIVSCGCDQSVSVSTSAGHARAFNAIKAESTQIVVVSGTSLRLSDWHFRLLGIKESSDPHRRQEAKGFIEQWFKKGWPLGIYNEDRALVLDDGVIVLWLRANAGLPCLYFCLNEELVRRGLVDI